LRPTASGGSCPSLPREAPLRPEPRAWARRSASRSLPRCRACAQQPRQDARSYRVDLGCIPFDPGCTAVDRRCTAVDSGCTAIDSKSTAMRARHLGSGRPRDSCRRWLAGTVPARRVPSLGGPAREDIRPAGRTTRSFDVVAIPLVIAQARPERRQMLLDLRNRHPPFKSYSRNHRFLQRRGKPLKDEGR
jgi:hypothetical protein